MKTRLSSYNIFVANPDKVGNDVWINGISGEVVRTSQHVSSLLKSSHKDSPDNLSGMSDELLHRLRRSGILTNLSEEDEEKHFVKIVSNIHKNRLYSSPTYVFIPTYECNLNCVYCFQHEVKSDKSKAWQFDLELADVIFSSLGDFEESCLNSKVLERSFVLYGGEPLLAKNKPIISKVIDNAIKMKAVEINAITNAYELEAYADLLKEKKINSLQITLDGPPAYHNKARVFQDGSGTFDKISENIQMALDFGTSVSIRTNISKDNIEQLPLLAETVIEKGWDKYENFSIYAGIIHGGNTNTKADSLLNNAELFEAIYSLTMRYPHLKIYKQSEYKLIQTIKENLGEGGKIFELFQPCFCGAHNNTIIFDGRGNIFTCMEQNQSEHYRIGVIEPSGKVSIDKHNFDKWKNRTIISNEICKRCPFSLFCGGGCAIRAKEKNGEMYTNYCSGFQRLFKHCVEIAMMEE